VRNVQHTGERRSAYRVPVGKPEGKRLLVRPRHNIYSIKRMRGVDWINLAQDRNKWQAPVNMVMNLPVP
jgi:hypothetical protein